VCYNNEKSGQIPIFSEVTSTTMPTYGYECTGCADHFEVVQSIKDSPLTKCERCGGVLKKRIYPVGISFKGSGFYVNDYAGKPSGVTSVTDSAPKKESVPETPAAASPAPKAEPAAATAAAE
jgi:putative FmdB family regulatory protein